MRQGDGFVGRIAVAVQRRRPFLHLAAAEGPAVPPIGRTVTGRKGGADRNGKVCRAAPRKVSDEQVEWHDRRADHRVLWTADRGAHRGQAEFVHAHRLIGVDRPFTLNFVGDDNNQVVIAHRRTGRGGPAAFGDPVTADLKRLIELGFRPAVAEAQCPFQPFGECKAAADRTAQDMFHVHRFAAAHQRTVEDGVKNVVGCRIAVGQIEISRADAVAPCRHREAEIIAAARRDHQRVSVAFASAVGFGCGKARADHDTALRIARAGSECLARATVGNAHGGARDGLAAIERRHPRERAFAAPFEMHRHVGDERPCRDKARRLPPEQGVAENGAGEFDDIESGLGQRNADDFEILARTWQAEFQCPALPVEQGFGAGIIDRHRLSLGAFLAEIAVIGIVEFAQPVSHLSVRSVNFQARAADTCDALCQLRLDRADGDRQHAAFLCFEDAERRGKLHQRWGNVEFHSEREAFGVFEHTPARILDPGGNTQRGRHRSGERPLERQVADRWIAFAIVGDCRFAHRTVGEGQADGFGGVHGDFGGKADLCVADRIASGLRIDARTFEAGAKSLAHRKVEALVTRRGAPVVAGNPCVPDQRHVSARGERTAAFDRHYGRKRLCLVRCAGRHLLRQPRTFEEIAQRPVVRPEPVNNLRHNFGLQNIERDLLANTVDRAIAVRRNRLRRRRNIGRDQKDLPLFDIVAIGAGEHCACRRPARVDGEGSRARHYHTARTGQLGHQIDSAADPAG